MPSFLAVCKTLDIWYVLASRIRFLIGIVPCITSNAATLPHLSAVGISCCEITASRTTASWILICCCWCGGNTSIIRSIVPAAPIVWSVENTRWPVSAAVIAVDIVSRSLISPTRITSGSSRSAARSASAYECVSRPISLWLIIAFLCEWRYSIGSSSVITWALRSSLILSIREASVVDLPEPVGPVTRTSPLFLAYNSTTDFGTPRLSGLGISVPTIRMAHATDPLCLNTLTLYRPILGTENEKSSSPLSLNIACCLSSIISRISFSQSSGESLG